MTLGQPHGQHEPSPSGNGSDTSHQSTAGLPLAQIQQAANRAAGRHEAPFVRCHETWLCPLESDEGPSRVQNGQTAVPRPTTLTWNAVRFAGSYEVQVDYLSTGGSAQLVERVSVNGLSHTSYQLGPGGKYRWRVQAISDETSIRSSWSPFCQLATRITR